MYNLQVGEHNLQARVHKIQVTEHKLQVQMHKLQVGVHKLLKGLFVFTSFTQKKLEGRHLSPNLDYLKLERVWNSPLKRYHPHPCESMGSMC